MANLRVALLVVLLVAASTLLYRIAVDGELSVIAVTGLVLILALALFAVLSNRSVGFSAEMGGVNAELSKLHQEVSEIKAFLYGAIDDTAANTLKSLREGNLVCPASDVLRDQLKFQLRTLRGAGLLVRDSSKCRSISDAVRQGGNISTYFSVTPLGVIFLSDRHDGTDTQTSVS